MSVEEKLPWRFFSHSDEKILPPDWHGEVLSKRLAKVEAGEGKFLTIPELKARLASKRS
jgi:hypothetical protein